MTTFFDRHLGLFVTGLTTLILIWKVVSEARYDTNVALAIITASPTPSLLLGVAVTLFPAALAFTIGVLTSWAIGSWARREPLLIAMVGLVLVLSIAVIALPVSTLIVFVVFALVWILLMRPLRKKQGQASPTGRGLLALWAIAVGIMVLSLVQGAAPWPREIIELEEGEPVIGYVLDDSGPWVSVLTLETGVVIRIPSADIAGREVCREREPASYFGLPLGQSVTQLRVPTRLPVCER